MPKVTQAIQNFFNALKATHNDPSLLERWTPSMETQINVAAGSGEPVAGKRNTYTDGDSEWWNIRIPKNANSDPEFKDYQLRWSFTEHADGIGCTGWDWVDRVSRWVGFDFDSITGHAVGVGVTDEDLEKVKAAASAIPWVEVRKSTGGNGLHLYVLIDAIPTANHTEHAGLARAILGMMATETGFDFASQIDVCGGNMWVWHRKMTKANQGLALIKPAERSLGQDDLPKNWPDHVEVVTRRRAKVRVGGVADADVDPFEALASSRRVVQLDDKHKAVIDALNKSGFTSIWVQDHHLLQTHTRALANLMDDPSLGIVGFFKTNSEGRDPGTPNCFLFPLDNGAWKVYRFGPGICEADTWEQDGDGWTTCSFNRVPNLKSACRAMGGVEDAEKGDFVFDTAQQAVKAAEALGQKLPLPDDMLNRETRLKAHKDGRLVVKVAKREDDEGMKKQGWLAKKDQWVQVFNTRVETPRSSELEQINYDNSVRVLVAPNNEIVGYRIRDKNGIWNFAKREVAKSALVLLGMSKAEAEIVIAGLEHDPWRLVNIPFQPEFPGDRMWNYGAVQYAYQPADASDENAHPHWDMVLNHCGQDLDLALRDLPWAQKANIRTGGDYLLHWAACMLREPFCRLPYLFFYGEQECGKSSFAVALGLLMTDGGSKPADKALTSSGDFNGDMERCVLAVIEEKNIALSKGAYDRVKDWVTNDTLSVHKKGKDPFTVPNMLHFIQTANSLERLAFEYGDTRCVVAHVLMYMGDEIPMDTLKNKLREEAPAFMRTIMDLQLPPLMGRLRLPVVTNDTKQRLEAMSMSPLDSFIEDHCHEVPGEVILFKDFFERFKSWLAEEDLPAADAAKWLNKQHVIKALPHKFPFGKWNHNQRALGNISFENKKPAADAKVYVASGGRLRVKE